MMLMAMTSIPQVAAALAAALAVALAAALAVAVMMTTVIITTVIITITMMEGIKIQAVAMTTHTAMVELAMMATSAASALSPKMMML
jgi:hypothetical protein